METNFGYCPYRGKRACVGTNNAGHRRGNKTLFSGPDIFSAGENWIGGSTIYVPEVPVNASECEHSGS
jgi:hypothetical protein